MYKRRTAVRDESPSLTELAPVSFLSLSAGGGCSTDAWRRPTSLLEPFAKGSPAFSTAHTQAHTREEAGVLGPRPRNPGSLQGARSRALARVCLAPGAANSRCSAAFNHVLFSAFKIYLYLWPCLTFFTEFPFPFKQRRPRKTEHALQEPRQDVS